MLELTYRIDEAFLLRAANAQARAMLGRKWISISALLAVGV